MVTAFMNSVCVKKKFANKEQVVVVVAVVVR